MSDARLEHVDHSQRDHERKRCGDDLEVHEGLDADTSEVLDVSHRGDAGDHGREDHRGDDHPDQLDEAVAERLHGGAEVGPQGAQQHADGDADEHLKVQSRVDGTDGRRWGHEPGQ